MKIFYSMLLVSIGALIGILFCRYTIVSSASANGDNAYVVRLDRVTGCVSMCIYEKGVGFDANYPCWQELVTRPKH